MTQTQPRAWEEEFDERFHNLQWRGAAQCKCINGASGHVKMFIESLLATEHQKHQEETKKMIRATEKMKCPLGERPWCIECSRRIRNHLIEALSHPPLINLKTDLHQTANNLTNNTNEGQGNCQTLDLYKQRLRNHTA